MWLRNLHRTRLGGTGSLAIIALLMLALAAPGAGWAEDGRGSAKKRGWDQDWFQGAEGYARGFEAAEANGQSVLVYFNVDWCGYCRQLESRLLAQDSVKDSTQNLVKISINPEKGAEERRIAQQYGVRGFPAVFAHPEPSDDPKPVPRSVVSRGERRLATPGEYIDILTRVTGRELGPS